MASEAGAALPWGKNKASGNDLSVDRDLPATLGMPLGSARIEVQWEISVDDEEEMENEEAATSYIKWWGARLHQREDTAKDGEGRTCYVLLYDADESSGYAEPTEHVVTFLDEHELWDMGEEEFLPWRMAGQEWVPPVVESNDVIDGKSLKAGVDKFERIMGMNATDALRANVAMQVSHLPPEMQRDLGERLSRGLDVLKEEIASMLQRTGEGGTVDMDAAEEVIKRMKERLKDDAQE